jgi:hypothetical protein
MRRPAPGWPAALLAALAACGCGKPQTPASPQAEPEGIYVSNRPDLTRNAGPREIAELRGHIDHFFTSQGLQPSDAHDLLIVAGVGETPGILFRFRLTPEKLRKLIADKPLIRPSRNGVLTSARNREVDADAVRALAGSLQRVIREEPWKSLKWWPPNGVKLAQMEIYAAPLDWPRHDISPVRCYLFVKRSSNEVCVAAN